MPKFHPKNYHQHEYLKHKAFFLLYIGTGSDGKNIYESYRLRTDIDDRFKKQEYHFPIQNYIVGGILHRFCTRGYYLKFKLDDKHISIDARYQSSNFDF
jgi:hypothetical protein